MLTAEQLAFAANELVTERQVKLALDLFSNAVYDDVEKALKAVRFPLQRTPMSYGMVGMNIGLRKAGWAESRIAAMGIRIYRAFTIIVNLLPETTVLFDMHCEASKIVFSPSTIKLIADVRMTFDMKQQIFEFPSEWFEEQIRELVVAERKSEQSVDKTKQC